jgi:hypothetical protein
VFPVVGGGSGNGEGDVEIGLETSRVAHEENLLTRRWERGSGWCIADTDNPKQVKRERVVWSVEPWRRGIVGRKVRYLTECNECGRRTSL